MSLETFGWGPELAQSFSTVVASSPLPLVPGRVVRQERGLVTVLTSERTLLARTSGKLLHQAPGAESLPTVGDWVAIQLPPGKGEGMLHAVLPRRSVLVRREVGGQQGAGQLIAANLDVVLLVSGLDGNFNARRIERALTLAWSSGATPAVLLTKVDLHDDATALIQEVEALAPGVPVLAMSSWTGEGLDAVRALMPPGKTGALLGSSGVGKSTLVNRLLGEERLATQAVRVEDDKGRHTTTHRELFLLPHGGLLIDGPGMRELGLMGDEEEALEQTFADILELADGCRFRDCTHQNEPGCAVRAAIQAGTLPPERLSNFEKLQREKAFQSRQTSPAAQREQRKLEKGRTVTGWEVSRSKRRKG
ncbi:ribosome small subunit-dependent GTPase A [Myxococcus sp. AM011]|uniref:ribosome small subunit-dependent GTPase A n=1 Tax=Myxococcus sp. AM011 TaxID=2745200 RepID=UPI0015954814|nr:ribosome small subunit-dependent GTPase A [Myxococcus sp. AM011]